MNYDVSLQSIAWINGRRREDSLEISPNFQRRPVWLDKERMALIATIYSRLPFPEIYIQTITDPATGRQKHVVVDGQQRVTSILMFIDGEVTLPETPPWNGTHFNQLTEDQQRQFWEYKIVVRFLSSTNDAEIRDLFTRLNTNNIALNDQELRNARHQGRFKQTAERIADNPLFAEIGLFTPRDVRRMLDIEFASELLLRSIEGIVNKKDMLDDAYAAYDEDFPDERRHEANCTAAIGLVRSVTDENTAEVVRTKSNFYSLFGAALRFVCERNRHSFANPREIARQVDELLRAARNGDVEGHAPYYRDYFEAVSRAASDKARRQMREEILFHIIVDAEG